MRSFGFSAHVGPHGPPPRMEITMPRITKILAAASVLGFIGLAACEEEVLEVETPEGEIEVEEDGDVNAN